MLCSAHCGLCRQSVIRPISHHYPSPLHHTTIPPIYFTHLPRIYHTSTPPISYNCHITVSHQSYPSYTTPFTPPATFGVPLPKCLCRWGPMTTWEPRMGTRSARARSVAATSSSWVSRIPSSSWENGQNIGQNEVILRRRMYLGISHFISEKQRTATASKPPHLSSFA